MEKAMIKNLLEKYWQAETTVEEEQTLAAYFQGTNIDPGLQPYRDLFAYFEEELQVKPAPGFDARILQRLGIADTAPAVPAGTVPVMTAGPAPELASQAAPVRTFSLGFLSAAAAIAALVIGLFLLANVAYLVTLPLEAIQHASSDRVATAMLQTIFPTLGAALMAVSGFIFFGLLDTRNPTLIVLGILFGAIPHSLVYGTQAALIAEQFTPRMRYSGASIGYQLASIIAGGPAPLIAAS